MGYRSDVRISTTKEGYERFVETARERAKGGIANLMETTNECTTHGNTVVFGWNQIKWYSSFGEVAVIEQALVDVDYDLIPYEFVRIGEEWEDIEYIQSERSEELDWHIEPVTSIGTWC